MSYRDSRIEVRLVVVGGAAVGKTALTDRYIHGTFVNKIANTTEVDPAFVHTTSINECTIVQQILDLNAKNSAILAWAHGIIAMYSVTSMESFTEALKLVDLIKEITVRRASIVLVGNKADQPVWEVPTELARKEAQARNCHFRELSVANDLEPVRNLFSILTNDIIQVRGLTNRTRTPQMVRKFFSSLARTRNGSKKDKYRITHL